ncbi:hypothetical protein BN1263520071 [Stenotrophomonas indicatrix]|nr:hypothetical protein BN1263520071 [Stenotrophomonas indicatrix]
MKRAEHRRAGEGEEARVSERSEFPRRPSTDQGAQGTGVRSTTARGLAARFFWLLFFSREKKSDTHEPLSTFSNQQEKQN